MLVCNLLVFEALRSRSRRRILAAAAAVVLPPAASLCIGAAWRQPDQGTVRVSIIQPNVDCYDKFHGDVSRQERNLIDLIGQVPSDAQFILLPETAVPDYYWEPARGIPMRC